MQNGLSDNGRDLSSPSREELVAWRVFFECALALPDILDVLEVFRSNSEKIKSVVLDLIGRIPEDLSLVSTVDQLAFTRGDIAAKTSSEDIRLFDLLE